MRASSARRITTIAPTQKPTAALSLTTSLSLWLTLMFAVVFATAVSAHRRDEYLQAARLTIAPGRVELQLDLTPGIAVADTIIADIDRNRDGVLSPDEQQAYAAQVLSAIAIEIDGHPVPGMRPAASSFPDLDALRRGEGTIAVQSAADLPHLSAGAHHLSYRNTHRRDVSVYLANPLVPDSDRVAIDNLQRDTNQRDLTIDYTLRGEGQPTSLARVLLLAGFSGVTILAGLVLRYFERSEVTAHL